MSFDIGVGMAAPCRQGGAQPFGHGVRIGQRRGLPTGDLELDGVDRRPGALQGIAVAASHDDVAEGAPQRRDEGEQRRSAVRRGVLAVHRLQQPIGRHDTAGGSDQRGQHRPLLRAADRQHRSVGGDGVDGTEHTEPHLVARLVRRTRRRRRSHGRPRQRRPPTPTRCCRRRGSPAGGNTSMITPRRRSATPALLVPLHAWSGGRIVPLRTNGPRRQNEQFPGAATGTLRGAPLGMSCTAMVWAAAPLSSRMMCTCPSPGSMNESFAVLAV